MASVAAGPISGGRIEITHPGKGHEVHLSAPAAAVGRDGQVLVTWIAQQGIATTSTSPALAPNGSIGSE